MGDVGYLDNEGKLWFCGRKAHRVKVDILQQKKNKQKKFTRFPVKPFLMNTQKSKEAPLFKQRQMA